MDNHRPKAHDARGGATTKRLRPIALTVAVMGLTIALGGCGGSGSGGSPRNLTSAAFQYASCMRNHGISSFPDPHKSGGPLGDVVIPPTPASVAAAPQFHAAAQACKANLPAPGDFARAGQDSGQRQHLVMFAACMRNRGVRSFPDPNTQGRLTITMVTSARVDFRAPGVLAAANACLPVAHGAITATEIQNVGAASQ